MAYRKKSALMTRPIAIDRVSASITTNKSSKTVANRGSACNIGLFGEYFRNNCPRIFNNDEGTTGCRCYKQPTDRVLDGFTLLGTMALTVLGLNRHEAFVHQYH